MIFLNSLFGYLVFLIILKWVTGSTADLYHIMIYMFLNPMDIDCGGKCTVNVMFPGQGIIQSRSLVPSGLCCLRPRSVHILIPCLLYSGRLHQLHSLNAVECFSYARLVLLMLVLAPQKEVMLLKWRLSMHTQPLLLVAALAAVPVMLLCKPLILKKRHEARHTHAVRILLLSFNLLVTGCA
jgi:hypothetical protein